MIRETPGHRGRLGIRGILFDLDGVLYNADEPIPNAAEVVAWIKRQEIPHLFVTNTTSRGRDGLVEKLARFGVATEKSRIFTPPAATAAWLRSQPEGAVALFVPAATRNEFEELPHLPGEAESGASYVVIGDLAGLWDYRTLNRAFRLLHNNPEARLIALGMTRYWLATDGISLDVAPFVAALEHATGRKATVLGKPARAFYHAAAAELGLAPAGVLMIGDDVETDVGGAQAAGLKGVLVKTGKFKPSDLEGNVTPDSVFDSVASLPGWWDS